MWHFFSIFRCRAATHTLCHKSTANRTHQSNHFSTSNTSNLMLSHPKLVIVRCTHTSNIWKSIFPVKTKRKQIQLKIKTKKTWKNALSPLHSVKCTLNTISAFNSKRIAHSLVEWKTTHNFEIEFLHKFLS